MPFLSILLVIGCCYVTWKLYDISDTFRRKAFTCLIVASIAYLGINVSYGIHEITESSLYASIHPIVVEWGHLVSLSFILGALSVFIRESKPAFAQFPKIYSLLPVLLILSYILVYDTYALKNWLLFLYQGGIILISLLFFSVFAYRNRKYLFLPIGLAMIFISYVLYWQLSAMEGSLMWVWKVILLGGILVAIQGLQYVSVSNIKSTQKID